jgi:hypothetical protein
MTCDEAQESISAAFDGEPLDADATDAHLAECATCRAFRRTLVESRRQLRSLAGSTPDVLDAVLTDIPERRHESSSKSPRRRARARRFLAAAAAISILGVVGVAVREADMDNDGPRVATPLGQAGPDSSVESMAGPDPSASTPPPNLPEDEGPVTAVIWSPGRLDPGIVPVLQEGGDPADSTVVRRGTVGLTESRDATGAPVARVDAGWAIPLEAIAVDPVRYGELLGGAEIAALSDTGVILSATSSTLRGIGVGGSVTVEGQDLTVEAVVSDEAAGAAEMIVSRGVGERLGLLTDRYVIVRIDNPAVIAEVVEAASTTPVRLRVADDTPFLRSSDAVTPQMFLKERFGEFAFRPDGDSYELDEEFVAANITTAPVPLLGQVTCHRGIVGRLTAALDEITERGLAGALDATRFQGCWNPRPISGSDDLSRHTWGVAFDVGWAQNASANQQKAVATVMADHGFTWGGPWLTPDPIHFEHHDQPEAP